MNTAKGSRMYSNGAMADISPDLKAWTQKYWPTVAVEAMPIASTQPQRSGQRQTQIAGGASSRVEKIANCVRIISGDSDFSPLVSKLRENAKMVIGVGVKNSTSDLLMANCDEFIFYDDLVREDEVKRNAAKKRSAKRAAAAPASSGGAAAKDAPPSAEDKKQEVLDLVLETVEALIAERGEGEKVWGSMVKQALKRRKPGFNESYYGFRAFSDLLDEAAKRKMLTLEHDEKSGGYVIRLATRKD